MIKWIFIGVMSLGLISLLWNQMYAESIIWGVFGGLLAFISMIAEKNDDSR
jgi:hypothetical protein